MHPESSLTATERAEARFLVVALSIGMRTLEDIEDWAARVLEQSEDVQPDIAELTVARKLSAEEVPVLLRKLGGAPDERTDLRLLLNALLVQANESVDGAREAAAHLLNLDGFKFSDTEVTGHFWSMFEDADGGFYGTPEEAATELRAYLRRKVGMVDA